MSGFVSHICGIRLYLSFQNSARKEILKNVINSEDPQELYRRVRFTVFPGLMMLIY